MSYDLIYDKQFVRATKDGKEVFFPIIYAGPSNCFEVGIGNRNGRRSRSWEDYKFAHKGKFYLTLEEMVANAFAYREELIERNKKSNEEYINSGKPNWCDEYSDERFGYFTGLSFGGGCKATFGQYKGLFITGCKKALTVEELREFGVSVNVQSSPYSAKELKAAGKEEFYFCPKTSQELVEKIDEFVEYLKDTSNVSMYISINADEYDMKRIRREKFPTKKTRPEYKDVDEFFVIYIVDVGYFYKGTRNGYKYSPYKSGGKQFATAKAAETFIKRFVKRYGGKYSAIIENVKQKTRLRV